MTQVRNTPSSQPGGSSQGSRLGSQVGSQAQRTGLADGQEPGGLEHQPDTRDRGSLPSSQGLAGAHGDDAPTDRDMHQDLAGQPRRTPDLQRRGSGDDGFK
ncbi:hypothetical protein [Caldimonas brevitalea]|uniref:Uncharacterized protein n=1 Tax=Caldimonas brevitalea TaxID=413882 RepID=A0A0G3BE48_9BURK|nr:hypothetical protein [Caldimonas brevitalea]AKJ27577.1 hypothetical protein AAW51_0886 [Caldimonas brevitalea]